MPKLRPAAEVSPALLRRRSNISQVGIPQNKTCPAVSVLRSQPRLHGPLLRDHHVRPAGVPDLLAAGGDGLLLQEDLQVRRGDVRSCVSVSESVSFLPFP